MSELRTDPVSRRAVIIAESRSLRPGAFVASIDAPPTEPCPFCEGHESLTPGEVAAVRTEGTPHDGPGWRVRVVPNKYPATIAGRAIPASGATHVSPVDANESHGRGGPGRGGDLGELFLAAAATGCHEVIVESPRHVRSVSELANTELADVVWMYRQRLAEHASDGLHRWGLVFKNMGRAAGASMEHAHSQLITLPTVPVAMREELTGSLEFHARHGRCVYCRIIEEERQARARMVAETPWFVAVCPFASRFPYETWLLPRVHASRFERIDRQQADQLADLLGRLLRAIERSLDGPAYNYFIHSAPFDRRELEHYHWHVEVIPRTTRIAGFECGTGTYINPVAPETAAGRLREAIATA